MKSQFFPISSKKNSLQHDILVLSFYSCTETKLLLLLFFISLNSVLLVKLNCNNQKHV